MGLGAAIKILRPKQWTKNLLVFAALIFAKLYGQTPLVLLTVQAFAALCCFSSAVYVVNDILDIERDKAHPKKRNRPLPSGALSIPAAWVIALVVLLAGLALSWNLGTIFLAGIGFYFVLQISYNLWFKRQPVLDVFILATGFVLRAALGAAPIGAKISGWLLFCTGALALLLGFSKRRNEFQMEQAQVSRPALAGYTLQLLDSMVVFSAALAALSYGVYVIESPTGKHFPSLILTAPFVIYGIARYVYLTFAKGEGGEPENLVFSDPHMIAAIVLFLAAAFVALSGVPLPFIGDAV